MMFVVSEVICQVSNGTVTCWDICSLNCQKQNGWLENNCMQSCGCNCEKDCEALCAKFQLGFLCKFKCGCFQDYTFGQNGNFLTT